MRGLAARLTGYKIDIKSETQAKDAPGFRYEDYMDDYEEEEYLEDGTEYEYAQDENPEETDVEEVEAESVPVEAGGDGEFDEE